MSRYKVLPVPNFFGNYLWAYTHVVEEEGDEPTADDEALQLVIEELKEEGFVQVNPLFNRDGWYYDRLDKQCWYEWRGTAWIAKYSQFEYELSQHEARILERAEVEAIKTLMVYGSCPMELRHLLWKHEQKVMLRNIYREVMMTRISILGR